MLKKWYKIARYCMNSYVYKKSHKTRNIYYWPHKREEEIENNEMEIIDDIKEDEFHIKIRSLFDLKNDLYIKIK